MIDSEKISHIISLLDEAITLEDWQLVQDSLEELNIVYEESLIEYPINGFDEEDYD